MMQAKSAGMSYLHKIVAGFIFRLVAQSLKSTVTADYVAVMLGVIVIDSYVKVAT